MSDIRLQVGSMIYGGWKRVSVTRSIEQIASTFSFGLSDKFDGKTRMLPVMPGDACKVLIDKEAVISGYLDVINGGYGEKQHDYEAVGRSKTGDLVDCTAIVPNGEFIGQSLDVIAKAICEPFGVSVNVDAPIGAPFERFRPEDASAAECLERACRQRGHLLMSDANGDIRITRVGTHRVETPLVSGPDGNIKSASVRLAMDKRFSEYRVKGQANGGANWQLEQGVQAVGVAKDPNVNRHRPLVVMAESGEAAGALSDRAKWEATTRLGRAKQLTVTVQGWKHEHGLWEPNILVRVIDPYFGIDAWLLIVSVTYTKGDDGTQSQLTLMPPQAFTLRAIPEQSTGQNWGDVFESSSDNQPQAGT